MKSQIIIARYNENLSWVKKIDNRDVDIVIYNKGNDVEEIFSQKVKVLTLENIGREAHTYLHHIISNYDDLPEKMIFTQAHPDDHVSKHCKSDFFDFLNSSDNFKYFSKNILGMRIDPDGVEESGILNGSFWMNKHDLGSYCVTVPFELIPQIESKKWIFGTGAIFGVSRKLVLKNSKEF